MSSDKLKGKVIQGVGVGLRSSHYQEIFDTKPDIPWFELLSDNYMSDGGLPILRAEKIREDYPITLHGVGMSLASADPLNLDYLSKLKKLAQRLQPAYVSDHLAWVSIGGKHTHDLLPFPYTEATLKHVSDRINQVQDFLGREILVENPSSYLAFNATNMTEWDFIAGIAQSTSCNLLLDLNNIYVSAVNHHFDPYEYLQAIPIDRVKEIHLAGYEEMDNYLFDTHGNEVHPPVWDLYAAALQRFGKVPTLIEWDTDIPDLMTLRNEAFKAEKYMEKVS
jgi:uncharacterized protein (UPF0276 family)